MMTREEYNRRHLAGERWMVEFDAAYEPPAEILALVHAGEMRDLSWRHDACPCFGIVLAEGAVEREVLIVTAPDVQAHPEYASDFEGEPRYMVVVKDEMGDSLGSRYCDDVQQAIELWRNSARALCGARR